MSIEKKYEQVGEIANYYGGLYVMHHDGSYWWIIKNYDTDFDDIDDWQEISKELYDAIIEWKISTSPVCEKDCSG